MDSMYRIGCSGYYYPSWKEKFYPAGLQPKDWLAYYSTVFNSVELNGTFYHTPKLSDLKKYAAVTERDFKFSVKMSKYISHILRLKDSKRSVTLFQELIREGLENKLSAFLFQMPPSFHCNEENLERVLNAIPHKPENIVEFRQELESSSEKQYRIEGGYETLISKLENECIKNNYSVFLSIVVKEINWGGTVVEVVSDIEERFTASKVLITVPLGILQSEQQPASISFYPPLPEKINAARSIGYGSVIKLMYQFRQPFWENEEVKKSTGKDLRKMSFVFSDQEIPTWWTQLPENACQLTGWVAGPNAVKLKSLDEKAILKKGLESLSAIFKMSADELKEKIVDSRAVNWITDPFSLGAYSYPTVNAERFIHTLREPVNNTLFFAGEALGIKSLCGTVEAALESGIQAANEILNNEEDPVTGIPEEAEVSFWSLWKTQMQLG